MRIVALTTCHNRRELTLHALKALRRQQLPPDVELVIVVVDDGSTDGTAEAVERNYPDTTIVRGSGTLFWAGGMRRGWNEYASRALFDLLLVFNDDVDLHDGALAVVLAAAKTVEASGCTAFAVSGAFINPQSGDVAYGAARRSSRWHPLRFETVVPSHEIRECDTLNMNFAIISRAALDLVGFLSSEFTHGMADYDFGLRLRRAGGRVVLAPGYVGTCNVNPLASKSLFPGLTVHERWRRLTNVKEQPPKERAVYYRRHGGFFWPIFFALPYVRFALESVANRLSYAVSRRAS